MDWDDVGDAIQQAVAQSSGVTTIWKDQNVDAPALPYVAISLGYMLPIGIDYVRTSQDLTRPAGQEIKLEVKGIREVPLEVEAFTDTSTAGRSAAALALCAQATAGLLLPSAKFLLQKQAVAPFDFGAPHWIPDVPSVNFRGRAIATVRCYMRPPTVAEYAGYIARVVGRALVFGTASGGSSGVAYTFDSNHG